MIKFYSLSQPASGPKMLQEIEGVLACNIANVLNNEKFIPCNLHPNAINQIGVVYTLQNFELIITQICCSVFKKNLAIQLLEVENNLSSFFE